MPSNVLVGLVLYDDLNLKALSINFLSFEFTTFVAEKCQKVTYN